MEKEILDLVDLTVTNLSHTKIILPKATSSQTKVPVSANSKAKATERHRNSAKQSRDKVSGHLERDAILGNQMTGTEASFIDVSQRQAEQASDFISDPLALA